MNKLVVYKVVKGSSDGTIKAGDTIWLSENEDLNNANIHGWLTKDEWNQSGINDFECSVSDEFVVEQIGNKECLRRIK